MLKSPSQFIFIFRRFFYKNSMALFIYHEFQLKHFICRSISVCVCPFVCMYSHIYVFKLALYKIIMSNHIVYFELLVFQLFSMCMCVCNMYGCVFVDNCILKMNYELICIFYKRGLCRPILKSYKLF